MTIPKYMSEEFWVGSRGYLVEVKQKQGSGDKYMIITQPGCEEDRQGPVIVFEQQMVYFMRVMDRAFEAVLHDVQPIEGTALLKRNRKRTSRKKSTKKKKEKANPPEFCNAGKRWTRADDRLLSEHFSKGTGMETLMKLFKRREGSITVRMYKIGLLPLDDLE